jgi:four helix bundle protein
MGKIAKFEDLNVWKESMKLAVMVYEKIKQFKNYGLKNQMERSSISVPSHISEGFKRKSNKEFIQYLYIAEGSCSELRTQIYLCKELGLLNTDYVIVILEQTKKISAMLYKLIKARESLY